MGKRIVSSFSRPAFPSTEAIDEDGQAKPCVYGVAWVNPDTLATLKHHGGRPSGPHGEAIEGDAFAHRPLR